MSRTKLTLHEELARILREEGNRWMTTEELAAEVNSAGHYRKKDGSAVTPFHVHGRTKNYGHLFERDGSRVRLRDGHCPCDDATRHCPRPLRGQTQRQPGPANGQAARFSRSAE